MKVSTSFGGSERGGRDNKLATIIIRVECVSGAPIVYTPVSDGRLKCVLYALCTVQRLCVETFYTHSLGAQCSHAA